MNKTIVASCNFNTRKIRHPASDTHPLKENCAHLGMTESPLIVSLALQKDWRLLLVGPVQVADSELFDITLYHLVSFSTPYFYICYKSTIFQEIIFK